jgi:hypothetical protein
MPDFASPASMSMHEESTITAGIPLMGVFNNLVVFDQHVAQNSCPEYREMKAATLRAPFTAAVILSFQVSSGASATNRYADRTSCPGSCACRGSVRV